VHVIRIMANLRVPDVDEAKSFYTGYLGLSTEEFDMGWLARFAPATAASTPVSERSICSRIANSRRCS
jgi:catechol 2,3-dioxygenase-like lactoylglutathione lyase family enzyme